MLVEDKISGDVDMMFYNMINDRAATEFGYDIKQVLQGFSRTVPFTNRNVVAVVALMSYFTMLFLKAKRVELFNEYKKHIGNFAVGQISWSDFVRVYWHIQKQLGISNDFGDDILTHLEYHAFDIMNVIGYIDFDIDPIMRMFEI